MVQLKEKNKDNSIPVSQLKYGQIAVITEWIDKKYIGNIIQYNNNMIVKIGCRNYWNPVPSDPKCRARILPEGTELIITNNQ